MAVNIVQLESKWFNVLKNGSDFNQNISDFTYNIVSNVGEKILNKQKIQIETTSKSSQTSLFTTKYTDNNTIKRANGSFIADGLSIGSTIDITYINSLNDYHEINGKTINALTEDTIILDSPHGLPISDFSMMTLYDVTPITAIIYKFGLQDNNSLFDPNNNVTGTAQVYYASDIGLGIPRSQSIVTMNILGDNKDYENGYIQVNYVTSSLRKQEFLVQHMFVVTPFYKESLKNNLINRTIPIFLESDKSLKYTSYFEFRTNVNNPNNNKIKKIENTKGSVGWFNENFNGYTNFYSIVSSVYKDKLLDLTIDSLNPTIPTTVTATITGLNFTDTHRVCASFFILDEEDTYVNKEQGILANMLFNTIIGPIGVETTNIGIITAIRPIKQNATTLIVEIDFEFSSTEQSLLTNEKYYAVAISVADNNKTSANSDRVNLLIDVNKFDLTNDIDGLMEVTDISLYQHNVNDYAVQSYNNSVEIIVEDTLFDKFNFRLNLAKKTVLKKIELVQVVYNAITKDYFILDSFNFPLTNVMVVNGSQIINYEGVRNFPNFNDVLFTTLNQETIIGELWQNYEILSPVKATWQSWIAQSDADILFYDNTKPLNNLNKKADKYRNAHNYKYYHGLLSTLEGLNPITNTIGITKYLNLTPNIDISDYNGKAIKIITKHPVSLSNLNHSILQDNDTLFIGTSTAHNDFDYDVYAIHRIEVYHQNGFMLYELSSLHEADNHLLKPLFGESNVTIERSGGITTSKCLIDFTKLDPNASYSLSVRYGYMTGSDVDVKITEDGEIKFTEDDDTKIIE